MTAATESGARPGATAEPVATEPVTTEPVATEPVATEPAGIRSSPGLGRSAQPSESQLPVIEFISPLPGFPGERRFVLVEIHDSGLLYSLTCVESPGLRFLVAPPAPFFPEYAPEVDDETLVALGTADPADLLALLVVSTGAAASDATVNLLAPIIVDQRTRRAVQLVLSGSGLNVREPLLMPRGGS